MSRTVSPIPAVEPPPPSIPAYAPAGSLSHDARRIIYLLDAPRRIEARMLHEWIAAQPKDAVTGGALSVALPTQRRRRGRRASQSGLGDCLATEDDPLLVPLRVAWMSPEHSGLGALFRLLCFGDPHDPAAFRKRWIRRMRPESVRVIVGDPATLSELRERWQRLGGTDRAETSGLAEFVGRQAALALDRAERRIRGMRYKVPRFVADEILERASFRGGLTRLAWETGRDLTDVTQRAARYLREMAATHSPYVIDIVAHFAHALYTRGYRERLNYDRAQLEHTYGLAQRAPVVFLPSHKSNLDHLVLRWALYENGHPPNHTAGGINMNFLPLGPLLRRSGVFFIRRTFKDNPTYKFVLGQYIDYLIEKRFPLEWYIEGGRSRSGKLLPPRFGLLAYVVDAYRRAKSDDVWLIPVSIAYDQIQDVGAYVSEQGGGAKEREGLAWFLKVFRMLKRRYGEVYIRFGEPLSLRETLGDPSEQLPRDERDIDLQKLAFEVSVRINRVTPITATSLVTLALLGSGDRALSLDETVRAVQALHDYVRRRRLPTTESGELETSSGIARALGGLIENGIVSSFAGGPETVYAISQGQHLAAAYYRNTVIHFFVNAAIVEIALQGAAADEQNVAERFWSEVARLRDLLKFEFFFADRETFRAEIEEELSLQDLQWRDRFEQGRDGMRELLRHLRPLTSFLVLRPFVEAYQVVADALVAAADDGAVSEAELLRRCQGLGKQYHLQRRIRNGESVSNVFFATGLRLARNRGLTDAVGAEAFEKRTAFATELRDAVRRIDAIEALAAGRRAGLID
jgi:glycerol-3-phosphate O-acyltransferase